MSEILDFYQQQAVAMISGEPWQAQLQKNALNEFMTMGFPNRYQEDWKYTRTDAFLQHKFFHAPRARTHIESSLLDVDIYPDRPSMNCHAVAFVNDKIIGLEALNRGLPPGVIIQPLALAMIEHADIVKKYLSNILVHQHGFHALNTAMLHNGLFIYLPTGVCLSEPILVSHWQNIAQQVVYMRHLVILDCDSSLNLVEDYNGDMNTCYMSNAVTEVALGARANLMHCKVQRESTLAYHTSHLAVRQTAYSKFLSHSFSVGGCWVRSDTDISLDEDYAQCEMNGVYTPSGAQHVDHHTLVAHRSPNCFSMQDYKGVLSGQARAVFNGRIVVFAGAEHTIAKQQNKNLLLSMQAEIDTKPQLEIFANDILCTHGATVGQLDAEALFYLATRGIGHAEASRYLVQAFILDNLARITHVELAQWISALLVVGRDHG